ncbi:MAG: hypothetical protein IRZ31_17590, partial [Thermogemmatispora sp.]|uniref:NotI family restriction endonuclease n=1 Tax=Thermogemmatispora sp. TaxID=1968838 RepID=UPI0026033A6F
MVPIPRHPLAEVFGFPTTNFSAEAERHRQLKLCPFHNHVPTCTKDKVEQPLGVCSVFEGSNIVITCPIRFRENWLVIRDAATFFFPPGTQWTVLSEVRLNDRFGRLAGNLDFVLVAYDHLGKIIDFGALEVQAVYISGNVRAPFEQYMTAPRQRANMDWSRL